MRSKCGRMIVSPARGAINSQQADPVVRSACHSSTAGSRRACRAPACCRRSVQPKATASDAGSSTPGCLQTREPRWRDCVARRFHPGRLRVRPGPPALPSAHRRKHASTRQPEGHRAPGGAAQKAQPLFFCSVLAFCGFLMVNRR